MFVRREGYLFSGAEPGVVPLKLYWNPQRGDNITGATPEAERDAIDAGYTFIRVEGYVKPNPGPSLVPLKLFWNPQREDNFLTGTVPGEASAYADGYQFIRIEGYAAFVPPTKSATVRSHVGQIIPADGEMITTVTVDTTGRVEGLTETINYAVFWGFQSGLAVFFSDANGIAVQGLSIKKEPFGVNGTAYGFSRRRDPWVEQIPPELVSRIEHIHIMHFAGGVNFEKVKQVVTQGADLAKSAGEIVATVKAMGAKGQ